MDEKKGQLTLTRKVGEVIKIGEEIEIVVVEIRRNQVRIGVRAPRAVEVYRAEALKREPGEVKK